MRGNHYQVNGPQFIFHSVKEVFSGHLEYSNRYLAPSK